IYFAPVDAAEGESRRPGRALFDASGAYRVTSFDEGDGLVQGTYRVRIECWKTLPTMETPRGESHVPADFSIADLIVEPGRSGPFDVDVPAAQ
ncbi:MAG: hypothetical protein KDA41_00660, partial [Planctomycetales bacterium]|nr:hypothetical protein [Planctomycetales bacterium]